MYHTVVGKRLVNIYVVMGVRKPQTVIKTAITLQKIYFYIMHTKNYILHIQLSGGAGEEKAPVAAPSGSLHESEAKL